MYRVSNEQIDYMLQQITDQGISDEGLRDSILDHVCCLIENSKEPIADFEICFQSFQTPIEKLIPASSSKFGMP
jgi:hypothetical protein